MNTVAKRLITVTVSLAVFSYIGFQVYSAFHVNIATQAATISPEDDIISARGFLLRNETLIAGKTSGIVDYVVSDGARVEKGGVVANVYPTAQQADNERSIRELKNRISQLQINAIAGNTMAIDINVLDADIRDKFDRVVSIAASTNLEGLDSAKSDFLNLLNERQIVTGKIAGFSDQLIKLQAECSTLQAQRSNSISSVQSPVSGYFVSRTDGFESCPFLSNPSAISAADVNKLLAEKPTAPVAVGKVVTSYEWYIAAVLSADDAQRLQAENSVTISFPFTVGTGLPATVLAVNRDSSGKYAVVLKCNYMTSDLASARSGDIKITLGSYSGLRVDDDAIRIVNGVKGVYVRSGDIVRFKELQIIFAGSGFVLSKNDPYNSKLLQVNDQIIVGGDNLHDGKIIR